MLRVEMSDSAGTLRIKLEGRLGGDDAEHTRILIWPLAATIQPGNDKTLVVDLTEVMFIDAPGEEVLSLLGRLGAQFVAATSYVVDVCERLHLRLARDEASDMNTSGASRTNGGRRRAHARKSENEKA